MSQLCQNVTRESGMKISDSAVLEAKSRIGNGVTIRACARDIGCSHVALMKRLKAEPKDDAGTGLSPVSVEIIRAVAKAGVPGGMERLARLMKRPLADIIAVAAGADRG